MHLKEDLKKKIQKNSGYKEVLSSQQSAKGSQNPIGRGCYYKELLMPLQKISSKQIPLQDTYSQYC